MPPVQSRKLIALSLLLRSSAKPPSAAELVHGLSSARARGAPRASSLGPSLVLGWAFVALLAASALVVWLAPSYFRPRSSPPELPMSSR